MQPTNNLCVIRFVVFEVDVKTGELRKQGARIKLPDSLSWSLFPLVQPGQPSGGDLSRRWGLPVQDGWFKRSLRALRSKDSWFLSNAKPFSPINPAAGTFHLDNYAIPYDTACRPIESEISKSGAFLSVTIPWDFVRPAQMPI
jgi:hypothetical protein